MVTKTPEIINMITFVSFKVIKMHLKKYESYYKISVEFIKVYKEVYFRQKELGSQWRNFQSKG